MKSVDWIRNRKDGTVGTRYFGSLEAHANTIFSYGDHYPLLFKIDGMYFVNTAGYSVTTSKHIGWAFTATDYQAIAVKVPRERYGVISGLREVYGWLSDELADITVELARKKRKDTNVYRRLQNQQAILLSTLRLVKERI